MNIPNLDTMLIRDDIAAKIAAFIREFEQTKHDLTQKRCIYLYGDPGGGKTQFVRNLLRNMDYDAMLFDAGDMRNKTTIEAIAKHNVSDTMAPRDFAELADGSFRLNAHDFIAHVHPYRLILNTDTDPEGVEIKLSRWGRGG